MRVVRKLGLFTVALLATFAVMFVAGRSLVPDSAVDSWNEKIEKETPSHDLDSQSQSHSSAGGTER